MDLALDLEEIRRQTREAARGIVEAAGLTQGQILVVGCSTSEVIGERIGSAGSMDVAGAIVDALQEVAAERGIWLAIQCCEHLNRALVVEAPVVKEYNLEPVTVVPAPKAGGATAATAMQRFSRPVVVEEIRAHAGMDIGSTLIGMHLRRVAVPVRLRTEAVGQARVTFARTRPKLIGGARAIYPEKC